VLECEFKLIVLNDPEPSITETVPESRLAI
jgi:hypothetical protein